MNGKPLDLVNAFPDASEGADTKPAYDENSGALDLTSAFPDIQEDTPEDRINMSLLGASKVNPDQYAQDLRFSEKLGLPPETVARHRDKIATKTERDESFNLAKDRPGLTKFLGDKNNAAVSRGDINNMAMLEDSFAGGLIKHSDTAETFSSSLFSPVADFAKGAFKGSAKGAVSIFGQMPYQVLGGAFAALESASKGFEQIIYPVTEGTIYERRGGIFGEIRDWALGNSKVLQDTIIESELLQLPDEKKIPLIDKPELILDPEWLADNVAQAGSSILAMIGAAAATGGNTEAAAFVGGAAEGGSLLQELIEDGVDDATALSASMIYGYAVTRLEKIGVNRWLGKERVKTLASRLAKSLVTGSVEAGTEWAEEPTQAFIGSVARGDNLESSLSNAVEATKNIDVMVGAFVAGGGTSYAGKYRMEQKQSEKVAANKEFFQALNDGVSTSQLKERSPERFKEYAKTISEAGNAPDNVYIPVERLEVISEQFQVDLPDLLERTGTTDQYAAAVATAGDIAFPMSEFTAEIAGTDFGVGLESDFRFDPYELTPREMQDFSSTAYELWGDDLARAEAEAERVIAEDNQLVSLRDDLKNSLLAIGMDIEQAEANAEIWTARAQVAARDYTQAGVPMSAADWVAGKSLTFADDVTGAQAPISQILGAQQVQEGERIIQQAELQDEVSRVESGTIVSVETEESGTFEVSVIIRDDGVSISSESGTIEYNSGFTKGKTLAQILKYSYEPLGYVGSTVVREDVNTLEAQTMEELNQRGMEDLFLGQAAPVEAVEGVNPADNKFQGAEFQAPSGAKGVTIFGKNQTIVKLYSEANKSTFLHESAHVFFEDMLDLANMEGAPFQLSNDIQAFKDFSKRNTQQIFLDSINIAERLFKRGTINAKEYAQVQNIKTSEIENLIDNPTDSSVSNIISNAQHELFARGFESYVREGKAPNLELQSAFRRFKHWLVSIYRSVRKLNVNIDDDIRGVMDRMLATEEEISQLEAANNYAPLYTSAADAEMTPQEFELYSNAHTESREKAREKMLSKLMKEIKNRNKQWYKEERARLKSDIEQALLEAKEYKALFGIGQGHLPGEKLPTTGSVSELIKPLKINTDIIKKEYGEATYQNLKKLYPRVTNKDGAHPDILAVEYGFSSADELVYVMSEMTPYKQAVQERLDEAMDQYKYLLEDEGVAEEAESAINDQARIEFLALEQEIASKRISSGEARIEAKRQRKLQEEFAGEDFAKIARRGFSAQNVRAARERARQIREVAREAISQHKTIDASKIAVHQRAERNAARDAVSAAKRGDNTAVAEAKNRQMIAAALTSEAMKAKEEIERMRKYLSKFSKPGTRKNIDPDYLEQIDTILERFDLKKSVTGKQLASRKSLSEWIQRQQDIGFEPDIPESIQAEAFTMSYKDMTVQQMRDLRDSVRTIEHIGRRLKTVMSAREKRLFNESVDDLVEEVQNNFGDNLSPEIVTRRQAKKKSILNSLDASLSKVEFICLALDGGKMNGKWWDAIYRPINDGVNQKTKRFLEVRDHLYGKEMFGRYSDKELTKFKYKKIFIPEIGTSLTKEEIIATALNRGNSYNWSAVLQGERWTPEQGEAVLSRLEERDWDVINNIWKLVDSFWPDTKALYRRLSGNPPKKVEAESFVNPLGKQMRGGYYPLVADKDLSITAARREESKNVKEMFGGNAIRPSTRNGHSKERTGFGGQPVALNLDVLVRHIDQVTQDIHLREAVIDVDRMIQDKRVQSIMIRSMGRQVYDQLRPWLASVAGQKPYGYDDVQKIARFFRSNATYAMMGWKATVFMSQYAGLLNSIPYLPGKKSRSSSMMFNHMMRLIKSPSGKEAKFIERKSLELRDRRHNFTQEVQNLSNNLGFGRKVSQWKESLMYFTGLADFHVSGATWLTAYNLALEEGATDQQAVDKADSTVRLSQGSGQEKDLAAIQRGDEYKKLWTMFYSYMSTNYNQIATSAKGFKTGKRKAKFIGEAAFFWFFPVIAAELLAGRGPDEDEDEEWLSWGAEKVLMHPTGFVPGMRDIVRMMEDDYGRPVSLFGRVGGSMRKLSIQMAKDELDNDAMFWAAIDTAGYFAPIPSGQARITIKQFIEWMNGERDDLNLLFYSKK